MAATKKQKKPILQQIQELGYQEGDIQPLHDRVLVHRFPEEEKAGSIWIPEKAQEKSFWGEVLAVGPGKMKDGVFHSTEVKPGDVVMFGKWQDFEALTKNGELLIIQEADVRVCRLPRVVQ